MEPIETHDGNQHLKAAGHANGTSSAHPNGNKDLPGGACQEERRKRRRHTTNKFTCGEEQKHRKIQERSSSADSNDSRNAHKLRQS